MARAAATKRRELDMLDLLKKDHFEVEELFQEFEKTDPSDTAARRNLLRQITRALSVHAAVEEQLLYPVVTESVPDGAGLAEEGIEEHERVKELLAQLERPAADLQRMEPEILSLIEDVRHHVEEEESEMFPKLRESIEQRRLDEMGRALEAMKLVAPTHPHPGGPRVPPQNIIVGVPLAVVDRARDVARFAVNTTVGLVAFGVSKAVETGRRVVERVTK